MKSIYAYSFLFVLILFVLVPFLLFQFPDGQKIRIDHFRIFKICFHPLFHRLPAKVVAVDRFGFIGLIENYDVGDVLGV